MRIDEVSGGLPPRPGGLAFLCLFPASLNRYISLDMLAIFLLDTLGGSPSARDYLTKMASREDCT